MKRRLFKQTLISCIVRPKRVTYQVGQIKPDLSFECQINRPSLFEKQKSKQHTSSNFSRILFISSKILPHKNNWSLWRLYVRCLAFSNTFSHHQDVLLSESLSYFAYKRFNVIVLFIRSFLYVKLCLGITKLYI